jgi:hypothetical protein
MKNWNGSSSVIAKPRPSLPSPKVAWYCCTGGGGGGAPDEDDDDDCAEWAAAACSVSS